MGGIVDAGCISLYERITRKRNASGLNQTQRRKSRTYHSDIKFPAIRGLLLSRTGQTLNGEEAALDDGKQDDGKRAREVGKQGGETPIDSEPGRQTSDKLRAARSRMRDMGDGSGSSVEGARNSPIAFEPTTSRRAMGGARRAHLDEGMAGL
ncbi:hypothetical protein K438DRAFT_1756842 [Mycena galopus ATCC 62051]|nr:hypothetical protein K438DRAFT_1756842 [Mycena galopus ATCC 62051]